ncbi:hypothetical protein [Clostridium cuniculi]|uniref:hypothetical protein n=1 Tax=Clostridium cuniculi TaxID=2548455 RepID=UPI001056691C|nr:hypothetical protein [Clostridium cuniculi]
MKYDCGFTKENKWFRYRAAAIIIEKDHILFAGNERENYYFLMKPRGTQELNSNSYTQGVKENMYWLPIDKLKEYRAYPTFFKEKLKNIKNEIEHIITYED